MSRNQIVIHLRNNRGFSLEDLVQLETFLCERDGLGGVEFDGHDYGPNDSNIFVFSNELEFTVDVIAKSIETRSPDLNFAVGAKTEGAETDYNLVAYRGIYEIIML